MKYWLVKQEPETFSWTDFVTQGYAIWDGVRSYAARNNLRAMEIGDSVLYYHSVTGKEVVGVAEVSEGAFQDPTDDTGRWSAVRFIPIRALKKTVTLAALKAEPRLAGLALLKQSRLSVSPLTEEEYLFILEMSEKDSVKP